MIDEWRAILSEGAMPMGFVRVKKTSMKRPLFKIHILEGKLAGQISSSSTYLSRQE